MPNAIFHRGSYLLLPGEFPTYEALMADLRSRELPATYSMIPLLEDNRVRCWTVFKGLCLAPYFLTGYRDEPSAVQISDPAEVYPAQVECLTQEEYNARLRAVINERCGGCGGYKPLSPKVQSLNAYFQHMSLDGVCLFRYESKPAPRSFGQNMQWLGGGFMRNKYAEKDAETMRQNFREWLHLSCDSAVRTTTADGTTLLTIAPKKKELLPPYLTLAVGHYVHSLTGTYRIQPDAQPDTSPDALLSLASPERRDAFRRECKKYGVSLADLTWDGQDDGRVMRMLWEQNKHSLLYPLHEAPGRVILLLMDTAEAMKALRFHTPMLQAHSAAITVHSQYHSRRYTVNFTMPFDALD
ncbi:MAG: hypothetical protein E7327_10230 [Clostridiales bacterium]|nr:hypothetical protein [Clostridiales bacterium]